MFDSTKVLVLGYFTQQGKEGGKFCPGTGNPVLKLKGLGLPSELH